MGCGMIVVGALFYLIGGILAVLIEGLFMHFVISVFEWVVAAISSFFAPVVAFLSSIPTTLHEHRVGFIIIVVLFVLSLFVNASKSDSKSKLDPKRKSDSK